MVSSRIMTSLLLSLTDYQGTKFKCSIQFISFNPHNNFVRWIHTLANAEGNQSLERLSQGNLTLVQFQGQFSSSALYVSVCQCECSSWESLVGLFRRQPLDPIWPTESTCWGGPWAQQLWYSWAWDPRACCHSHWWLSYCPWLSTLLLCWWLSQKQTTKPQLATRPKKVIISLSLCQHLQEKVNKWIHSVPRSWAKSLPSTFFNT